jgi:predicted Zn-ribbon and HTH transcriptional regulator
MPAIVGQCIGCHAGAIDDASTLFPSMAQCFECHEHKRQFDAGECGPCHESADLKALVPQSFMRHDAEWFRHHGAEAAQREQVCSTCHDQKECNDCHDITQAISWEARNPESMRELVHPADFLTRHGMEAASQPARCLTCHEPATCDGCHVERGVSALGTNPASPHPPGWIGGNPSSRNFHGRAARRDLLACAACHDQGPATNCIGCHRVGAYGGNPHPGGWRSSRSETSSMCRYCHVQ